MYFNTCTHLFLALSVTLTVSTFFVNTIKSTTTTKTTVKTKIISIFIYKIGNFCSVKNQSNNFYSKSNVVNRPMRHSHVRLTILFLVATSKLYFPSHIASMFVQIYQYLIKTLMENNLSALMQKVSILQIEPCIFLFFASFFFFLFLYWNRTFVKRKM